MPRVYILDADEGMTDDGQPKNGIQNLETVMAAKGININDTFQVSTPSKGRHYYFLLPDGVNLGNTQSTIAPYVDTRGTGGMIVWAGSVMASVSRRR